MNLDRLRYTIFKTALKHLPGQHNQKRHGWRYGSVGAARRSMRWQEATEREEYRKRAGMPGLSEISATKKPYQPTIKYHQYDDNNRWDAHNDFHNNKGWSDWESNLTTKEAWAMKEWIDKPYGPKRWKTINATLRSGSFDPAKYPSSGITNAIKGLDSALGKGELHRNMTLWRGVDAPNLYSLGLKAGDKVKDLGYMASSPTKSTATNSYFMGYSSPVLFKISAKSGAKGAYMSWSTPKINNPYMHESEFLLPRGSELKLTKDPYYDYINGYKTAVYEVSYE